MMKRLFQDFGIQSKLVPLVLAKTSAGMLLTGLVSFSISSNVAATAVSNHLVALR